MPGKLIFEWDGDKSVLKIGFAANNEGQLPNLDERSAVKKTLEAWFKESFPDNRRSKIISKGTVSAGRGFSFTVTGLEPADVQNVVDTANFVLNVSSFSENNGWTFEAKNITPVALTAVPTLASLVDLWNRFLESSQKVVLAGKEKLPVTPRTLLPRFSEGQQVGGGILRGAIERRLSSDTTAYDAILEYEIKPKKGFMSTKFEIYVDQGRSALMDALNTVYPGINVEYVDNKKDKKIVVSQGRSKTKIDERELHKFMSENNFIPKQQEPPEPPRQTRSLRP